MPTRSVGTINMRFDTVPVGDVRGYEGMGLVLLPLRGRSRDKVERHPGRSYRDCVNLTFLFLVWS